MKFTLDPLKALDYDEITIDVKDSLSPAVLRVPNTTFLYVLMPMRIA